MLECDIKKNLGNFNYHYKITIDNLISVITGASGSGKSTFFKAIAGLDLPDEGYIRLNGKTLFDSTNKINLKPQERRIGLCFQFFALFPNMNVQKNITSGLIASKKNEAEKKEIFEKTVEMLDIKNILNQKPYTLSGGQAQRVALARLIVNDPEIFLFDEVFSSLDEELSLSVQKYIKDIIMILKKPSIFITHSRTEANYLSNSQYKITSGRINKINL